MKTYRIKVQKIVEQTYIINAETEDQAKQIIESGEINTLNDNYDDDDYEENDYYENECTNGNEYIEFTSIIQIN